MKDSETGNELMELLDTSIEAKALTVKIIGVGGAGANAVDRLQLEDLGHVGLAVVNTDGQALASSPIGEKVLLGRQVTRGLSAGGEASIGKQAADSDRDALARLVKGVDLVFLVAGLGGGTGSGAAPVLADIAVQNGAMVICFATLPFSREGTRRVKQAEEAVQKLRGICHAVIRLPNDILLQQVSEDATVMEAFAVADGWIDAGVRAIGGLLFETGLINVDYAALRGALGRTGGQTLFGTGYGDGKDYVEAALRDLENCPLLSLPENRFGRRTDSLVVNLTGGPDLSMAQVNHVMEYIQETFGCRDSLVLGANINGGNGSSLRITVLGSSGHPAAVSKRGFEPVQAVNHAVERDLEAARSKTRRHVEAAERHRTEQSEFAFQREDQRRGVFEDSGVNLHEGEDLDIPTYLRRGIRIHLRAG